MTTPDLDPQAAHPAPDETQASVLTDDGYLIDPETGEILFADLPDGRPTRDQAGEPTEEFALILLRGLQRQQARESSAQATHDLARRNLEAYLCEMVDLAKATEEGRVLVAQLRAAEEMLKGASKECERFEGYARPTLRRFAQIMTQGRRSRSWKSVYGTLQLRRKPATITVDDEEKAVALYEELGVPVKKTPRVSDGKTIFTLAYEPAADEETIRARQAVLDAVSRHPGAISYVPSVDELEVVTGV